MHLRAETFVLAPNRVSLAGNTNGPQVKTCGPSGGLFGIDQEVVTLRGLSRQLPGLGRNPKDESLRATDAMPSSVLTG